MKRDALQSVKLAEFAAAAKIPRSHAAGILISVWQFASRESPDGDLTRLTPAALGQMVDDTVVDRDAQELLGADTFALLAATRWIDPHPYNHNAYVIHDWLEHCENYVLKRLVRLGRLPADWCRRTDRMPGVHEFYGPPAGAQPTPPTGGPGRDGGPDTGAGPWRDGSSPRIAGASDAAICHDMSRHVMTCQDTAQHVTTCHDASSPPNRSVMTRGIPVGDAVRPDSGGRSGGRRDMSRHVTTCHDSRTCGRAGPALPSQAMPSTPPPPPRRAQPAIVEAKSEPPAVGGGGGGDPVEQGIRPPAVAGRNRMAAAIARCRDRAAARDAEADDVMGRLAAETAASDAEWHEAVSAAVEAAPVPETPSAASGLEALGVAAGRAAQLVDEHGEDRVAGWVAYAEVHRSGLSNPAGLVLSKLAAGDEPPAVPRRSAEGAPAETPPADRADAIADLERTPRIEVLRAATRVLGEPAAWPPGAWPAAVLLEVWRVTVPIRERACRAVRLEAMTG